MIRRIGISKFLTAMLVMLFSGPNAAAGIAAETRWADPSLVKLDIEFPGDGYHANWELFRCDCGDLLVRSELNVPGEVVTGELLLVAGRAVLSRGFGQYKAEAAASLDAAALMMQLTLRLLERSEPAGPSRITQSRNVELEDTINHINLDTGTAVGGFQAPWSISGSISAAGETQRRFDLRFSFTASAEGEVQKASMRLSGLADFADSDFPIDGSESLQDWGIDWRNENDASAGPAGQAETLDELREVIRNTP